MREGAVMLCIVLPFLVVDDCEGRADTSRPRGADEADSKGLTSGVFSRAEVPRALDGGVVGVGEFPSDSDEEEDRGTVAGERRFMKDV